MSGTVDLIIRVLGDVKDADLAALKISRDFQTAMANVQIAVNKVDFAPNTDAYKVANDQIIKDTVALSSSFEDVATVYAQGTKFLDEFGNRLPTDKVNEYTDTMLRLSKVSADAMDPKTIGQRLDVFEKLFDQTNFAQVGAASAALAGVHNLGEDTLLQAMNAIAVGAAPLGARQEQVMGLANTLSDVGKGGQVGGSSITRMLLRMDTASDAQLDPESKYATVKKNRDAQERLDDLRTSLREAEASRSEMYGQHGLKTQYQRNPEAVMASDDRIAKLNRDIADQQENILHENDPNRSRARGVMNISEMAKTAGMTADAFAELDKADPVEALTRFVEGLHKLPTTEVGAAETRAGLTNARDVITIDALAPRPEVLRANTAMAAAQLHNLPPGGIGPNMDESPNALITRSDIALSTANAHLEAADAAGKAAQAIAAAAERDKIDEAIVIGLDEVKDKGFGPFEQALNEAAERLKALDWQRIAAGAIPGGGVVQAGVDVGGKLIHYGDVIINHPDAIQAHAEQVKQDVIAMMTAAWNAAGSAAAVPSSIGGNYSIAP